MTQATTDDDEVQPEDVLAGSGLAREWDPEDWRQAYRNAEDLREAEEVREAFRDLDSGRFWEMLEAVHTQVGHSDLEGRRSFADDHPEMLEWAAVWGLIENMARFHRYTDASEERPTFGD